MLQEAKIFISMFDKIVPSVNNKEINDYKNKLKNL